ncbi:MAG TPA: circularly permuted type 2 ATP-grasp protein [Burkholderiaceae bacterium]|nr:circularly permuted type 2 ATP-grasp protein [Burkholderiaceae bacterium]
MSQTLFQFDNDADGANAALGLAESATPGHYDELRDSDGALRPAWRAFFGRLGTTGLSDLHRREILLKRQVHEHGVTYNVYSDEHAAPRRWSLELLPFVVAAQDWKIIESAVVQRAAVLSAVMRDVYGPKQLIREGLLPPALVLGNPGYLRSLHGIEPPGGIYLHVVAFDLARGPDGRWWVLGHRAQAPSGLGYALENRLIVSRLFGESFGAMQVQRLAASYRRLLETLMRHAPRDAGEGSGPPRIVLLTPGRYNETYFEQAYLAHYLGVALVEGEDLTVRDDRLYLKTLHGLERVHAVIRRLDDVFCDPLELRADSELGVPGLLHAIRRGKVLVANALGAAFLESPAIHGFLPAIARRVLGEELVLPPRDSWWCGESAARERAFTTLHKARVRATYRGTGLEPAIAKGTGLLLLSEVRKEIEQCPDWFTIQSYLPYSKAPCWSRNALVPRSAMLRVYVIATGDGGWHAMPGGLTRIADRQDEVSMQRGGSSADTWVVTGEQVDPFTMLPERLGVDDVIFRRRIVTSRAAENLFWLGRYSERTDNAVRAAQVILSTLRASSPLPEAVLTAIGRTSAALGLVPFGVPPPALGQRVFERTLLAGLGDEGAKSVAFDLAALAGAAAQIRDRLAFEHWHQITATVERYTASITRSDGHETLAPDDALAALASLVVGLAAITGAQADGMTRDDGWRLLTIGRQIERLICMNEVLHAFFASGSMRHESGFDLVLAMFNSTITYRSRYQGQRDITALVDLLVLESANPRSLACAVELIGRELGKLCAATGQRIEWKETAIFEPSHHLLLSRLCERDDPEPFADLLALTRALIASAKSLSNSVSLRYFSHSEAMRSQIV